jgi:hypothetical protein
LINLPQSIQGLTLCNRKVVVKSLGNIGDYNNSPVFWGFTIMTAIHEFVISLKDLPKLTMLNGLNTKPQETN